MEFTLHTFPTYKASWHHEKFCEILDKFSRGEIKRLMCFMPPRHGKSELTTRRLPAKMLGDNPNKAVAVVAYNDTFSRDFNLDVQNIIDSPEYRELYPETTLPGKNAKESESTYTRTTNKFNIVGYKGQFINTSYVGAITGRDVDVFIIDDPYKGPEDAFSPAYRKRIERFWHNVVETRLDDRSQVLMTFTRWHHEDIGNYLLTLQPGEWEVVVFPAIKEGEPTGLDPRRTGEPLWPEKMSLERLQKLQREMSGRFDALYQQNPTNPGGDKIKRDWFFVYERANLPEGVNHVYIDTALSDQELKHNDPSGILVGRVHNGRLHLVHYEEGHWSIVDLAAKIKDIHRVHLRPSSKIHIENKANGRSVKQILQKESQLNVLLDNIKGGKEFRVEEVLHHLESGKIGVPLGDSWVESWMQSITTFPKGAHDEAVDTLTGLIRKTLQRAGVQFANPIR